MMEGQRPGRGELEDNSISSGEWLLLHICETGEEKMPPLSHISNQEGKACPAFESLKKPLEMREGGEGEGSAEKRGRWRRGEAGDPHRGPSAPVSRNSEVPQEDPS